MKLLVDAGNSRVKLGWLAADGTREDAVAAFDHADLAAALPGWLSGLPAAPEEALGVNVAGVAPAAAIEAAVTAAGGVARWVTPPAKALGLVNGYRNPAQLGADRWVAMLGLWAHPRHGAHTGEVRVLASFGTATTIDTLSPDGRFEGGLILPGMDMMLASLARGTANLPLARGAGADFPADTDTAIVSGALAAQAGAVVRQLLAARARYGGAVPRLAVAGGAWPAVRAELEHLLAAAGVNAEPVFVDNPVLDGLAMLAAGTPSSDDA